MEKYKMDINEAMKELINNAEIDLLNDKKNKKLKEATKMANDWINETF